VASTGAMTSSSIKTRGRWTLTPASRRLRE
jgi:hypothetical protein